MESNLRVVLHFYLIAIIFYLLAHHFHLSPPVHRPSIFRLIIRQWFCFAETFCS
jgi:hypothetical protein